MKGKNEKSLEFKVRREKVKNALLWLIKNNPLYHHVTVDYSALESLPKNDFVDLSGSQVAEETSVASNEHVYLYDAGPPAENTEVALKKSMELTSMIPSQDNLNTEDKNIVMNIQSKFGWTLGETPLNEFQTQFLATMAFPTLFPDRIGDSTSNITLRNISENETESFSLKLKHLIKFGELDLNQQWNFRFASHPRFAYWAFNLLYRRHLLSQGTVFVR